MKFTYFGTILVLVCSIMLHAFGATPEPTSTHTSPRVLMVHYMPWFEAKPMNTNWGWHWTMNHYHPDTVTNGRPEAASHYTPLMGLYDSSDADALECQVLLMKLSGIDGVVIDWYGNDDYLDFGRNHRCTLAMIQAIKKAHLHFAICYEDHTVSQLISGHVISESDAVAHGQKLMAWMQEHWFSDPAYLTLNDHPVFLVFGSGYYSGEQWNTIFAELPKSPFFFTEEERRAPAVGGFAWPQPSGGNLGSAKALDQFYDQESHWTQAIPTTWPRFDDIYEQAGVQKSWGHIDDQDGRTYSTTLERALKSNASVIQIATWNDWGEGTQIEPSVEFGYRDLETTLRLRRKYSATTPLDNSQYLQLPIKFYELKKKNVANAAMLAKLDAISRLMFDGHWERARTMLATYQTAATPKP